MSDMRGVVGYFESPDSLRRGIDHFAGLPALRPVAYMPIPDVPAFSALNPKTSGVRWFGLVGGLTGIAVALSMTIWMSWDYPLIVGGKPITALPPFLIVGFELMVLLGSIASVLGFLFMARLPDLTPSDAYRPPMGVDRFALYVPCAAEGDRASAETALREAGADEITVVNASERGRLKVTR